MGAGATSRAWACAWITGAASGATAHDQSLTLVFDNDIFAGTDQLYTNGVQLDYHGGYLDHFADGPVPRAVGDVVESIPSLGRAGDERFIAYSAAHLIFTPEDTHSPDPPSDDLPYSGFLLLTATFMAQDPDRLDAAGLTIGIVGQHSYAAQTQASVHHAVDNNVPAGWSHQLHDEPIVNLGYERRVRFVSDRWTDLLGSVNAALGNFATTAGMGAAWRFGYDLPDDFRMPPPFAGNDAIGSRPWSRSRLGRPVVAASLFASGTLIAHFAPFDGDLFGDSPHIAHDPWVVSVGGDLVASTGRATVVFSLVDTTIPYETPNHRKWDRYGRVSLTWAF
jgi:hypothetical protein